MEDQKAYLTLHQNDIFESLTYTLDTCKNARKLHVVQAKIIRVDELKTEFDTLRKEILIYNSKTSDPQDRIPTKTDGFNTLFDAIYSRYLELKATHESENQSDEAQNTNQAFLNLQPLKLIQFNGQLEKWQQFKSLFDSLIHENRSLPDIQKLHYLKSHIFGEAAALIQNIEIDEANYKLCYDILVERYSSPRRLINYYSGQLLNFDVKESKNYDRFLIVHMNAVKALKNLNLTDLADCLLFQLCYRNLCISDRQAFDNSLNTEDLPNTDSLFNFLKKRVKTNELQIDLNTRSTSRLNFQKPIKGAFSLVTTPDNFVRSPFCQFCKGAHRIYTCYQFLKSSVAERKLWIEQNKKCSKCLGSHADITCQSTSCCKECNSTLHHTYLHDSDTKLDDTDSPQCFVTRSCGEGILLGTINLRIKTFDNEWITVRGILDTASQVNLMTSDCLKKLKLPINTTPGAVSGVSHNTSFTLGSVTCEVDLGISSEPSKFCVLNTICSPQPNFTIPESTITKLTKTKLADKFFYKRSPIEVLLGAELVSKLISNDNPVIIHGKPSALKTHYGFVLLGKTDLKIFTEMTSLSITNDLLNDELRKFWEVEENTTSNHEAPENIFCEDFFLKTYSRDHEGRYQVRLPFKPNSQSLKPNRFKVFNQFLNLEKRLLLNPDVKNGYNNFLKTYLNLDYMEKAKIPSDYLHFHHVVFKDSTTTSLRVVINGSTPDAAGNSLNSNLFTGPKLQRSLPEILDNFRSHRFVIAADISKMFNQILVHPDDRKHQHILWRPPEQKEIQEFELKRLSFGHVSSPWLALRVLRQLVNDEGSDCPRAAHTLTHWTYVDDILTGVNSIEEGKLLISELIKLLQKGGFHLKKWISNSLELLENFSPEDLEIPRCFENSDNLTACYKVLGITWLPKEDIFSYKTSEFNGPITKRNIISFIARLYDPCGWCAPVVLKAKLFIQKCWLLGLDWDKEIPDSLSSQWKAFVNEFHFLSSLKIPRNIPNIENKYRLLGFSDGSSEAYGCCIYLQEINDCNSKCYLLRAKSKVCPLRTISIPRIELLAALTLVKLTQTILTPQFPFFITDVYYFTDSEIVLFWISSSPHKLKTFVANRVSEILSKSSPSQWRHVSSQDNPSDPISRGLQPSQLLNCNLYWSGPSFLSKSISDWPTNPAVSLKDVPELKTHSQCLNVVEEKPFVNIISNYSSLTKVQNIFAYIYRFFHNVRNPKNRLFGPLSPQERKEGLNRCAYVTQQYFFKKEFKRIQQGKQMSKAFIKLSPFVEEKTNLLRAGGRLQNAQISFEAKNPVILPKSAHLSKLICEHFHVFSFHSGVNTVQALIMKNWWILSLRGLLRKCVFSCVKCYRLNQKTKQPYMSDLPANRVCISKPFSHVGTDFCGPFVIKESRRRNAKLLKSYLCIFICFSTKAVHLETVSELSTAAFMASFDRFISRRSLPVCVYSDKGTNYQGANNQIKEIREWLTSNEKEIYSKLSARQVQWKFSPPNAPNFGGLWEGAVKSAKVLLLRTLGNYALTFEELTTVFTKIEGILNSRPLTPLTPTPDDDIDFLTPGHFLVGGPIVSIPESRDLDVVTPLNRWKHLINIKRHFWRRWSQQYLHSISQRTKWNSKTKNIEIGQIVYMTKINSSPLSWPLGRVISTHPGKDGVVRVVTVRTAGGTYVRPTNSLLPLPF